MKTLASINELLTTFEKKFGVSVRDAAQGSEAWHTLKLGVISASNASKAVAKSDSETRLTYMSELVAQVCTGISEEINSKAIDWGKEHEDAARSNVEFLTGDKLIQVPFVFKNDSFRVGCSPDSIVDGVKGNEIKCPFNTVHYIKFLTEDKLKPEYQWQNQFQMWVLECDKWEAIQFDPRMKIRPIHSVIIERDEAKIKTLEDAIPQFIADMDKMLNKIGVRFGDQWAGYEIDASYKEVAS